MKNIMIKIGGYLALLMGAALFFTQCETDLNGAGVEEPVNAAVTTRGAGPGTGDCMLGTGPGFTAAELCNNLAANFPKEELSEAEIKALLYMREEEKLARDVYLGLYDKWQHFIFDNISKAEQHHMDAVGCLIDKYELTDPAGDNPLGVFENETLQEHYENLIASGVESLEAALTAGATIEDLDIFDLKQIAPDVGNEDITTVFSNLTRASSNHLRAFLAQLTLMGVTYEPVYLSAEEVETIIASPMEPAGLFCGECPYYSANKRPGNKSGRPWNCPFRTL